MWVLIWSVLWVQVLILIIVYDYLREYALRKYIFKGKWTWAPEPEPPMLPNNMYLGINDKTNIAKY